MRGVVKMDDGSFIRLKILEDDIEGVVDMLVADKRIDEDVRNEYGERISSVLYAGVDEMTNGNYLANFK